MSDRSAPDSPFIFKGLAAGAGLVSFLQNRWRMAHTMVKREVLERSVDSDNALKLQWDRGVAGYRCKIYKTLLEITSESDNTKRPFVVRSGRWMATPPRS